MFSAIGNKPVSLDIKTKSEQNSLARIETVLISPTKAPVTRSPTKAPFNGALSKPATCEVTQILLFSLTSSTGKTVRQDVEALTNGDKPYAVFNPSNCSSQTVAGTGTYNVISVLVNSGNILHVQILVSGNIPNVVIAKRGFTLKDNFYLGAIPQIPSNTLSPLPSYTEPITSHFSVPNVTTKAINALFTLTSNTGLTVRKDIEARTNSGKIYNVFLPAYYSQQYVSGINYAISVVVDGGNILHIKLNYNHWTKAIKLLLAIRGYTLTDTVCADIIPSSVCTSGNLKKTAATGLKDGTLPVSSLGGWSVLQLLDTHLKDELLNKTTETGKLVKQDIECLANQGAAYSTFVPFHYSSQVVSGTNYVFNVIVDGGDVLHVKLTQTQNGAVSVLNARKGYKITDNIFLGLEASDATPSAECL